MQKILQMNSKGSRAVCSFKRVKKHWIAWFFKYFQKNLCFFDNLFQIFKKSTFDK
jgi:hypothetical protein